MVAPAPYLANPGCGHRRRRSLWQCEQQFVIVAPAQALVRPGRIGDRNQGAIEMDAYFDMLPSKLGKLKPSSQEVTRAAPSTTLPINWSMSIMAVTCGASAWPTASKGTGLS